MKILFVKESQNFPRSSGHDVHGFHMMLELQRLGHSIGLCTGNATSSSAIEGLDLIVNTRFSQLPQPQNDQPLEGWQGRFVHYWGIEPHRIDQIAELARRESFDAVIAVGLHVLPYLARVENANRVWYAADEWFWHHWSQFRLLRRQTWGELRSGVIKGLYERVFNSTTDRVWAVSPKDKKAFHWVMGARRVDVLPNGVDSAHFRPMVVEKIPKSCVFWGRLDFGPNLDAIRWFGENVWTRIRSKHPDACWKIFGFSANQSILDLKERFQFDLTVDLPDLRAEVQRCQIVVLPFVSGGGIKNKALEAASMGMPIIASAKAINGISMKQCPIGTATTPEDWLNKIEKMWKQNLGLQGIGEKNRVWVSESYTWTAAAKIAESALMEPIG
jgi:glycosyltransferase involved in cell wall biosynthesis